MPITTQSFQTLRQLEGLVHDMMRDLENVMRDADYLGEQHQKNFNNAGKLRNIARNSLDRIIDVRKDIQQLEFGDTLNFDDFAAKKKSFMNECHSIEVTVHKQWAEVQGFIVNLNKIEHGDDDVDLEQAYEQVISSNEVNINLEKS